MLTPEQVAAMREKAGIPSAGLMGTAPAAPSPTTAVNATDAQTRIDSLRQGSGLVPPKPNPLVSAYKGYSDFAGKVADKTGQEFVAAGQGLADTAKATYEGTATPGQLGLRAAGATVRGLFAPVTGAVGTTIESIAEPLSETPLIKNAAYHPIVNSIFGGLEQANKFAQENPEKAKDIGDAINIILTAAGGKAGIVPGENLSVSTIGQGVKEVAKDATTGVKSVVPAATQAVKTTGEIAQNTAKAAIDTIKNPVKAAATLRYGTNGDKAFEALKGSYEKVPLPKATLQEEAHSGTPGRFAEFMASKPYLSMPVKEMKWDTFNTATKLREEVAPEARALQSLLDTRQETLSEAEMVAQMKAAVQDIASGQERAGVESFIDREVPTLLDQYAQRTSVDQAGNRVASVADWNKIKQQLWDRSPFKATASRQDNLKSSVDYAMGSVLKRNIESAVDDVDIQHLNQQLGDYYHAINVLENLHGGAAPKGRLGADMARIAGAVAGTPGGIIGSVGGYFAADRIVQWLSNPEITTAVKRAALQELKVQRPKVADQVAEILTQQARKQNATLRLNAPSFIPMGPYRGAGTAVDRATSVAPRAAQAPEGHYTSEAAPAQGDNQQLFYYLDSLGKEPPKLRDVPTTKPESPKGEGGGPDTHPDYTENSRRLAEAFNNSKDQEQIGRFELGSFGRNAGERKVAKQDRFPASELAETEKHITEGYKASTDTTSYRSDNVAWVAQMPDGETRIIYTRLNPQGKEEIVNWHSVSDPKYVERLKSFGAPERTRTSNALGRNESTAPSDGGTNTIPQNDLLVKGEEAFKDFEDLSTKILSRLEGKTIVSKQFISDLTKGGDIKQAERDLINNVLEGEKDRVSVKSFANKVRAELLPLERTNVGSEFESIVLPDEVRGNVDDYSAHVYNSPIKTDAGAVHFKYSKDTGRALEETNGAPNYFAHTRVEDLPDDTRRVIELQSDLFQKGRLENELPLTRTQVGGIKDGVSQPGKSQVLIDGEWVDADSAMAKQDTRMAELKKLEPYRNTWHERVIREEIKQAAKDGKTTVLFPTGETAMRVEGLAGEAGHVPENSNVGDTFEYGGEDYVVLTADSYDGTYGVTPLDKVERRFHYDEALQEEGDMFAQEARYEMKQGDISLLEQYLPDDFVEKFKTFYEKGPSKEELSNWIANNDNTIIDAAEKQAKEKYPDAETMASEFDDMGGEKYFATPDGTILVLPEDVHYNLETMRSGDGSLDVDTNDPIYKFYEKEVGRYLKNKYKAEPYTDDNGVTWWKVSVTPEHAKAPIQAFGFGGAAATGAAAESQSSQ